MREVRLLSRARADVERIAAWWRANRPAAPTLFENELEAALRRLSSQPDIAPVWVLLRSRAVRRLVLIGSRAHVYYVVYPTHLTVVRLWGAVRGRAPSFR